MLSFFIPTYGRSLPLKNAINSIIDNWKDESLEEIIISDNNESDLATNIVSQFHYPAIKYFKNKSNIGIDKNMLRAYDVCSSKYCWMLGDDDQINNETLKYVLPFLKKNLDFILIVNESIKKYTTGIYDITPVHTINDVFANLWDKVPFGNLIVNIPLAKKLIKDDKEVFDKYIGTSHAYTVIWELLASKHSLGRFGIITEKAVDNGIIEKSWSGNFLDVYLKHPMQYYNLMPEAFNDGKVKVYKNYYHLLARPRLLFTCAQYLNSNNYSKDSINDYFKNFPLILKVKLKLVVFFYPFLKFIIK